MGPIFSFVNIRMQIYSAKSFRIRLQKQEGETVPSIQQ